MDAAIYPGSFDPPTYGHIDIIKRALKIFDKIIIAIGVNPEKNYTFSEKERIEMLKSVTGGLNVEIDTFSGLLVDYAKNQGISVIIRSLREVSDFSYEFQMSVTNKALSEDIETVFLMTDKEYFYLNSTIVKNIAHKGGDLRKFVPSSIAKSIKKHYMK